MACVALVAITVEVHHAMADHGDAVHPDASITGRNGVIIPAVRCGTPDRDPAQADVTERGVESWLAQHAGSAGIASIVTIPVAVHVVRGTMGEWDVTDSQITSQIAVLNGAFATTNFRFALVHVDRTDNTAWSQHMPDSPEESAMKSALAVSPATTLNLYTCRLTSLTGHASSPWDYPESDPRHGVVVLHSTLPGGGAAPYDEGHIATHQVGHFVGLYHTFQGGCFGSGDLVADTPAEAVPAYGCPLGRDTCSGSGPDPIHNFMDYSDDACMTGFTAGQSARMDAQMAVYKPTMVAGGGGYATGVVDARNPAGRVGLRLAHGTPNPVRGEATIVFDLPELSPVSLVIHDAAGRRVAMLLRDVLPAGSHAVGFDGRTMTAGVYFCRLTAGTGSATLRVLIAR